MSNFQLFDLTKISIVIFLLFLIFLYLLLVNLFFSNMSTNTNKYFIDSIKKILNMEMNSLVILLKL